MSEEDIVGPAEAEESAGTEEAAPKRRGRKKIQLDLSRKYSTVHGINTAARFCQDGRYFNVDGQPCEL